MKTYEVIVDGGKERWKFNGKLHNESGPAVVCGDYKKWYKNGKLHNKNGPSVIYTNGEKRWHINGKLYNKSDLSVELETAIYNSDCDGKIIMIDNKEYKLQRVVR